MTSFDPETTSGKTLTFSFLTTPGIFQTTVEGAVEKRQGRTFGPPGGKKMALFVDDISMPAINDWGDQVRVSYHPATTPLPPTTQLPPSYHPALLACCK
jgi:hypothetical protein